MFIQDRYLNIVGRPDTKIYEDKSTGQHMQAKDKYFKTRGSAN